MNMKITETRSDGRLIQWVETHQLSVVNRQRLYIDGKETPYFVDKAYQRAHFTYNMPVGLFGSGMHPSGCAATFGGFQTIREAQAAAVELATKA